MIFDIDAESNQELKVAINQVVNDAITAVIRAGMSGVDAGVNVRIVLISRGSSDGKSLLEPKYKYKTKIKIGESYEAGKGQLNSPFGMYRDEAGYWHQQRLDEQMKM